MEVFRLGGRLPKRFLLLSGATLQTECTQVGRIIHWIVFYSGGLVSSVNWACRGQPLSPKQ